MRVIVPDNYPDIPTAINSVPPEEFAEVFVRAGRYVLNPTPKWPPNQIIVRPNLYLHGEGIDKTIIEFTPADASPIRADVICNIPYTEIGKTTKDIYNWTLEDLTVNQYATPDNKGSSLICLRSGSHSGITFRRVKALNAFGAGLAPSNSTNVTVEDCIVDKVWTGINLANVSFADVRRNTVTNVSGDAIFPQGTCKAVNIEYNTIEVVGDVAIDVTGASGQPPHQAVKVRHNRIKYGGMRISNAVDTEIIDNSIEYGSISIDAGAGRPVNTLLEDNRILSSRKVGLGCYGAEKVTARRNRIIMTTPEAGVVQSGLVAAVWGTGLFEENEINGGDYGIDFGGWALSGGSDITFTGNKIFDFRNVGIYDNAKNQGPIKILENQIWTEKTTARWGILTDYEANPWIITHNALKVRNLLGNDAIHAPGSTLTDNYAYTPKPPIRIPIVLAPIIFGGILISWVRYHR